MCCSVLEKKHRTMGLMAPRRWVFRSASLPAAYQNIIFHRTCPQQQGRPPPSTTWEKLENRISNLMHTFYRYTSCFLQINCLAWHHEMLLRSQKCFLWAKVKYMTRNDGYTTTAGKHLIQLIYLRATRRVFCYMFTFETIESITYPGRTRSIPVLTIIFSISWNYRDAEKSSILLSIHQYLTRTRSILLSIQRILTILLNVCGLL